jgi:hypothetical protein
MVPLILTGELLGIAHFYHPENHEKSDFAFHGHHYTPDFFMIAREMDKNVKEKSSRLFKLWRISKEFIFRANSIPSGKTQPPLDLYII